MIRDERDRELGEEIDGAVFTELLDGSPRAVVKCVQALAATLQMRQRSNEKDKAKSSAEWKAGRPICPRATSKKVFV